MTEPTTGEVGTAVGDGPASLAGAPAPAATLDLSRGLVESAFSADFWRALAPAFRIEGPLDNHALGLDDRARTRHAERVLIEGYTHLEAPGLMAPMEDMATLFARLVSHGVPPVFSFVYDEFWLLSRQLDPLISAVLQHEYVMLPDFWAWHIEAGRAGFAPHRDKGPDCLFPDRRPKSVTAWLPLTEAHPLNGCMYLLPANRDTCYGLQQQFGGELPDVRALPAQAGDVFVWTQHLFHWGSHAADTHDYPPRMSVAFEFQRTDVAPFNTPLLAPGAIPDFDTRLLLIAKQILQYRHLYSPPPALINLAQTILSRLAPPDQQAQRTTYGPG